MFILFTMSYVYLSEHVNFRLLRWAVYRQFTGGFTASWAGVFSMHQPPNQDKVPCPRLESSTRDITLLSKT